MGAGAGTSENDAKVMISSSYSFCFSNGCSCLLAWGHGLRLSTRRGRQSQAENLTAWKGEKSRARGDGQERKALKGRAAYFIQNEILFPFYMESLIQAGWQAGRERGRSRSRSWSQVKLPADARISIRQGKLLKLFKLPAATNCCHATSRGNPGNQPTSHGITSQALRSLLSLLPPLPLPAEFIWPA